MESTDDDDERLQKANDDLKLLGQICLFVSFFTELGIAYRHKTPDRKLTFNIWEHLVPNYWQKLEFFVIDRQARVSATIYNSFKILADDMPNATVPDGGTKYEQTTT